MVILGRRADHGRSADVDILDQIFHAGVRLGGRLLEPVEIDRHHIDGRDTVLANGANMRGIPADGENSAVDFGMQSLHAAVEHFGKAGDIGNILDWNAGFANQARGAAGRDEFRSELGQSAGKIENSCFIGDTDEDAANLSHLKKR